MPNSFIEALTSADLSGSACMSPQAADEPTSVWFHRGGSAPDASGHDVRSKMSIARAIAHLLDIEFGGELDPLNPAREGRPLIVPAETLVGADWVRDLGVGATAQLFGGVVPHAFVASKVISHPLVNADAQAPGGWSAPFAERVRGVVLEGFTVFGAADLAVAGKRMLASGPARLKQPDGVGGAGQHVIRDVDALNAHAASLDPAQWARTGLVIEQQLEEVATHSVGQVQIGRWTASYVGTQRLTRNHRVHEVYGGSTLTVVRGGYDALRRLALGEAERTAVEKALVFHGAALACFPGLIATRSNYDVASGLDATGRRVSGVLEQSWRIGGASGAEIAALHAFRADPSLQVVTASTHEVYGEQVSIPPGASVHFDGIDPQVGRLTKYAITEPHGHA